MRNISAFNVIFFLALVGLIAGCVTTEPNIIETGAWEQAQLSESTSIVFGRVLWLENGTQKMTDSSAFYVEPRLLRLEDKSRHLGRISENGEFAWALAPGNYVVDRIIYRDTWSGMYYFVPKVGFRIPEKGKTYYIGTLRADFSPKRDFIGGLSGQAKISIENDREDTYEVIEEHLRIPENDIENSLMVHDERLPAPIETDIAVLLATQIMNSIAISQSQ